MELRVVVAGIVGCRHYSDYAVFSHHMNEWCQAHGAPTGIISGGASGVDSLAEAWAAQHNIPCTVIVAEWSKYGAAAGPIRNTALIQQVTHVVAFPSATSRGTWDSVNKGKAAGKEVTVYQV